MLIAQLYWEIKYTGRFIKGIHQPIISEGLFELIQKTHKKE